MTLTEYIQQLLLSEPLDIYSEEENFYTESSFELVHPRPLFDRKIGSANLFIAAALVCQEYLGEFTTEKLNDPSFLTQWNVILDSLIEQKFIRETQLSAHSKIKLVVDNT